MKRSEKEAEVRRLLETPGAVVQLPAGMSVQDAGDNYEELIQRLVAAGEPVGGWEIGPTPSRLRLVCGYRPGILPFDRGWASPEEREDSLRAAVNAFNAMKEAEETESNPNDPLTVAPEKVAAEEIAGLVEDVAKVTQEVYTFKYTREEFVAAEFRYGVEGQGLPGVDFEELDPDVEEALRKRAEWNAQAAERAGVVWRHQSAKVACRNCGGYERPEKISDYGECRRCVGKRLELESSQKSAIDIEANEAWTRYLSDPSTPDVYDHVPRFLFNAGFGCGYQAGWRARMDTLNPVCSPEAVDEVADETLVAEEESGPTLADALAAIDEINRQFDNEIDMRRELAKRVDGLEDRADQHKASIATIAESQTRVESEWKIQGQKYTADLRRVSGKLELLEESINGAHSRLQLHDVRITKTEEQIRTFIQPAKEQ